VKANGDQKLILPIVPCPRLLFQTLQRFMKTTHMRWECKVNKTKWLCHAHLLLKNVIQERIMEIQLMNRPTIKDSDSEYKSNRCWLNHQTKRLQIMNLLLLSKTSCDQPCFISFNTTISVPLNLINPPTANYIHRWSKGHYCPSVIIVKGPKFFLHGFMPNQVPTSILKRV